MVVGGGIDLSGSGSGASPAFLNIWNTATGTLMTALPTNAALGYYRASFSPDSKSLAVAGSGSYAGSLQIWNISSGILSHSFVTGLTGEAVAFSANGKLVAVAGSGSTDDGFVQVWSLATGKLVETLNSAAGAGIYGLSFSPDGSKIAVCGAMASIGKETEGVLELWNVANGELASRLATKATVVNGVAFSPDSRTLAAGGQTRASAWPISSGILELWNVTTEKIVKTAPLLSGSTGVSSVYYSRNGRILYAITSGLSAEIQAFDSLTHQRLGNSSLGSGASFALSPTNGAVATAASGISVATMLGIY
jgi:WD40 repeat protein